MLSDREAAPLRTLEELFSFTRQPLCVVDPLRDVRRGGPESPKTLLCHDLMDGYLDDRFVHGCRNTSSYRFFHWQVINSFVYFSHNMVTIPPPGWISAAHKHGVKVLGTFTVKSDWGTETLTRMRRDNLALKVASHLALVASRCHFDGWLVDIESKMEKCHAGFLKELLAAITTETHRTVPGSLIIWYDSVLCDGALDWQNELNEKNSCFFDLCDGIFLNSGWTEDALQRSAAFAGDRKSDVYVGIDVYARRTSYIAGYKMYQVVEVARSHGLSAAILGSGWVYETQDKRRFMQNQSLLWSLPDHCCPEWRLRTLPLSTSFCQGFGGQLYEAGQVVSAVPWFNLSLQQLQPRDQSPWLCCGCGSATGYTEDAYDGGGCLRLRFLPDDESEPEAVPYFRLFGCDFPLGRLTLSYTFKQHRPSGTIMNDVALVLKVKSAEGKEDQLKLGVVIDVPNMEHYAVTRDISDCGLNLSSDISGSCWVTRTYRIEDLESSAILEEIGISFVLSAANACLLGKLVVERPDCTDGVEPVSFKDYGDSSDDSGPDMGAFSDEDSSEKPENKVT
ncbi:cytosolic endo-beta-N-acetylglucosaminidase-like isoform X2 [Amblyomma americanum]